MHALVQVGISALYVPISNYKNPVHAALLCMAQSAPSATGLEDRYDIELVKIANNTGNKDLLLAVDYAIAPATRVEAMEQMWNNLVAPWVALNFTDTDGNALLK